MTSGSSTEWIVCTVAVCGLRLHTAVHAYRYIAQYVTVVGCAEIAQLGEH